MFKKRRGFLVFVILLVCMFAVGRPEDAKAAVYKADKITKGAAVRILLIGNSFSDDTAEYMYTVAKAAGYQPVIGKCTKGGADLEGHSGYFCASPQDTWAMWGYTYLKNSDGNWKNMSSGADPVAKNVITDEPWDFVFFQQQSCMAGLESTFGSGSDYSYIREMSTYVRNNCTNINVKIGYEMTWAVPENQTTAEYISYYSDENGVYSQKIMYESILNATKNQVASLSCVDIIAPVGTAVQNARSGYMGDTLCRDDRHMSLDIGRSLAAMSLVSACGIDISGINSLNVANVSIHLPYLKQCIADSECSPYGVTAQSKQAPVVSSGSSGSTVSAPKGTSIRRLAGGKKSFTVKWKKQTGKTSGYQIRYSTSKNMKKAKTVTVGKKTATSKKIKGLKKKRTYYVQVRTYRRVSGTVYPSSWSAKKKVKTK